MARREYPVSPLVAVSALLHRRGRLLLVRRASPPNAGRWALPGGLVELGEGLEEALAREMMEELGIRVRLDSILDASSSILLDSGGKTRYHYVLICYAARPLDGAIALNRESSEFGWFEPRRAARMDVTEGTSRAIKKFLRWARSHR
jgi:8-oxo-dGTP diphosphatase